MAHLHTCRICAGVWRCEVDGAQKPRHDPKNPNFFKSLRCPYCLGKVKEKWHCDVCRKWHFTAPDKLSGSLCPDCRVGVRYCRCLKHGGRYVTLSKLTKPVWGPNGPGAIATSKWTP